MEKYSSLSYVKYTKLENEPNDYLLILWCRLEKDIQYY